jgi:hypothetical protein
MRPGVPRRTGCKQADEVRSARLKGESGRNFLFQSRGKKMGIGESPAKYCVFPVLKKTDFMFGKIYD